VLEGIVDTVLRAGGFGDVLIVFCVASGVSRTVVSGFSRTL
jgi:hypothetical protein